MGAGLTRPGALRGEIPPQRDFPPQMEGQGWGRDRAGQSGQALVLVAVVLLALIGSTALVLLAGSVAWQRNQLQELADATALDASFKIGIGCDAVKAQTVITEADNFLNGRRARTGVLAFAAGPCAAGYQGTDTFTGPITATINYPYRADQQEVEVILTLNLPISFGGVEGTKNTAVTRRALAQGPAASVAALTAGSIDCQANAQMNIQGSIVSRNLITSARNCALYTHARFDAASGTFSDFGNVTVSADGQAWTRAGAICASRLSTGSLRAICADGYELTGTFVPRCATAATEFLDPADRLINPNPCAAGAGPLTAMAPPAGQLSPEPNLDPSATATLLEKPPGANGAPCTPGGVYPVINVAGTVIGTGLMPTVPVADAAGYYHFKPSCYGYLDISLLPPPRTAAFDPGFYYFNGSGLAGGGGICVNGRGQLVGRDITLEFVGNSSFTTGDCNRGGGGGGAFGSTPCSQQPCPPNSPADAPNAPGLTWLAAPCATPPDPLDANSCRGGLSWCPVGDRACWNLLIWAPAAIAGSFQVDSRGATAWLLGTISWPGACFWGPNASSAIAGAVSCGTFQFANGTSLLATIGGDAGVNTALAEALLVE